MRLWVLGFHLCPKSDNRYMKTRESIRLHILENGTKVSRFRPWAAAVESEMKGLLREHLPSGYSNWFAVVENKSIWWIYSDSSDGGVWTTEGVAVNGCWIPYDEDLARAIYDLAYPRIIGSYKESH